MESSVLPDQLKIAKISPIYTGKDKSYLNNYRPISILSVFSKLFEKVFYSGLYNFLDKHKLLSENQYGYRQKRSTIQAVIYFKFEILEALLSHKHA